MGKATREFFSQMQAEEEEENKREQAFEEHLKKVSDEVLYKAKAGLERKIKTYNLFNKKVQVLVDIEDEIFKRTLAEQGERAQAWIKTLKKEA